MESSLLCFTFFFFLQVQNVGNKRCLAFIIQIVPGKLYFTINDKNKMCDLCSFFF
jgi:hypothetical protein